MKGRLSFEGAELLFDCVRDRSLHPIAEIAFSKLKKHILRYNMFVRNDTSGYSFIRFFNIIKK